MLTFFITVRSICLESVVHRCSSKKVTLQISTISQENTCVELELNIKMAHALNCVWSSDLKANGIFVMILSQDDFESDRPETKFETIFSQSQFRISHTQLFFKIGVLKNFSEGKHLCWSLFFKHLRWLLLSVW